MSKFTPDDVSLDLVLTEHQRQLMIEVLRFLNEPDRVLESSDENKDEYCRLLKLLGYDEDAMKTVTLKTKDWAVVMDALRAYRNAVRQDKAPEEFDRRDKVVEAVEQQLQGENDVR
jgi:hypothetical protein